MIVDNFIAGNDTVVVEGVVVDDLAGVIELGVAGNDAVVVEGVVVDDPAVVVADGAVVVEGSVGDDGAVVGEGSVDDDGAVVVEYVVNCQSNACRDCQRVTSRKGIILIQ